MYNIQFPFYTSESIRQFTFCCDISTVTCPLIASAGIDSAISLNWFLPDHFLCHEYTSAEISGIASLRVPTNKHCALLICNATSNNHHSPISLSTLSLVFQALLSSYTASTLYKQRMTLFGSSSQLINTWLFNALLLKWSYHFHCSFGINKTSYLFASIGYHSYPPYYLLLLYFLPNWWSSRPFHSGISAPFVDFLIVLK